jgi:hypothetical protein
MEAATPFAEAPHPPAPQILKGSGQVLANPKFVAVSFNGDPNQAAFDSFLSSLGSSMYWSQVTAEYGVGPGTALTPVHLGETAPTTIDTGANDDVGTWLQGKLDGTHPEFGTPDSSTIYMILYPASTTTPSCYHSAVTVGSIQVPFGVSAGCGGDYPVYPVTHELIEASTDPYPGAPGAYWEVADSDYAYPLWTGAYEAEVGDLCQVLDTKSAMLDGSPVTTAWSNAAAAAGHDPCVPNQMNRVYFNSIPVLPDVVPVTDPNGITHMANGLSLPVGQQKTIELDLFSDGPTGEWTVSCLDVAAANMKPTAIECSFDKTTGKNGDKLQLTVTAVGPGTVAPGVAMFAILSTMGDPTVNPSVQTQIPVVVVNN